MSDVGYSLEAVHVDSSDRIVHLELSTKEGDDIVQRLWSEENIWSAPGGCSFRIESQTETDVINEILKTRLVCFNPDRHRWHFHIYLA